MVRRTILAASIGLSIVVSIACGKPPSDERARKDEAIGILETSRFRLEIENGLGQVRSHGDAEVVVRAAAAELKLRVQRRDASLERFRLRLWNLPPSFSLQGAPGVLTSDGAPSSGSEDLGLHLGASFDVMFPPGVDEVTLVTPPRGSAPFTFLAFGDIQNGIDRFGDVVAAVNLEPEADFILMLGDLTVRARSDEFDRVEAAYADIRFPVYATIGNHDVDATFEYQARFGRVNSSFAHKGARFTSLDSASADLSTRGLELWEGWASEGRDQLHAVFTHIPTLDRFGVRSGQWNSRRQAHRFLAIASDQDVDLLLFGHIHSFDAYALAGIPTYISGGCGAFEEKLDGIGRHYLRIRADPAAQRFEVEVVRVD